MSEAAREELQRFTTTFVLTRGLNPFFSFIRKHIPFSDIEGVTLFFMFGRIAKEENYPTIEWLTKITKKKSVQVERIIVSLLEKKLISVVNQHENRKGKREYSLEPLLLHFSVFLEQEQTQREMRGEL